MHPILDKLIRRIIIKDKRGKLQAPRQVSDYQLAKGFRELKIVSSRAVKDFFLICTGIASASFGLKSFILPNRFVDGGATGISLLTAGVTQFPFAALLVIINIPFILLGFTVIGKQFAVKTALAIIGLSISVAVFTFPVVTEDKLLVAIFGGFFLGAGIGLSVRGGAVIDGTEVLAIFLSKRLGTTIGDIILMINILIFSTAAYLLSIEVALYSIITYLAASKTLDFIIEGIEEYTGVTIISAHSDEIRDMIVTVMGRGVTIYEGKRGYGKRGEGKPSEIVYTVLTRLEVSKLNLEIQKIDPNAFVVMNSVKEAKGGMIKKRRLKH